MNFQDQPLSLADHPLVALIQVYGEHDRELADGITLNNVDRWLCALKDRITDQGIELVRYSEEWTQMMAKISKLEQDKAVQRGVLAGMLKPVIARPEVAGSALDLALALVDVFKIEFTIPATDALPAQAPAGS